MLLLSIGLAAVFWRGASWDPIVLSDAGRVSSTNNYNSRQNQGSSQTTAKLCRLNDRLLVLEEA